MIMLSLLIPPVRERVIRLRVSSLLCAKTCGKPHTVLDLQLKSGSISILVALFSGCLPTVHKALMMGLWNYFEEFRVFIRESGCSFFPLRRRKHSYVGGYTSTSTEFARVNS
jgi:hypothetical protein